MKIEALVFVCGLGLVSAVGCGKKEESGAESSEKSESSADKGKAKAAKGDPNVWMDLELPKLGLIANVPGNAKVSAMGGISTADWSCGLSIYEKAASSPTYDNMVMNIEKGNKGGALKEMVKNEKTDEDNWMLQWTTEPGKFAFASNKKIGERVYTFADFQITKQEKLDCSLKILAGLKAK